MTWAPSGGMTVGRSRSQLPVGTGGVEYSLKVHGPLKFPKISLTAEDRARAEDHLAMVKKREKKFSRRSAEAKIRPKRKQKQTKRSLKVESDSDEEFLPGKKKFLQEVEYRDEKGNILPKTAAKCPGKKVK